MEFERKRLELGRLNTELEIRRAETDRQLDASLNATTALRRGKIVYRAGEEVARSLVDTNQTPFRLRIALEKLMETAATNAEVRGATRSGQRRAALILPKIGDSEGAAIPPKTVGEDDSLQLVSDVIQKANEPVVVVALAAANTVEGEPVPVELRTFRNPIILLQGAKIGEVTIPNDSSEQQVLDTLYSFLRRDVRQKLLTAGAIPPVVGSDSANLVTLSGDEWFRVVRDVRRIAGMARVTVRSAKTLHAADAVTLTFEVQPAERMTAQADSR